MAYQKLETKYINGLQVFDWIHVDHLRDLKLYPDDVWVVTYPKCGTTWTQQIVKLIRSKGEQDGVNTDTVVPWIEFKDDAVGLDKMPRPRAFRTHFPYDLLPGGPPHTTPCKYIYVARNPKDVAVSYYHHMKLAYVPDLDKDVFVAKFLEGNLPYGSYFDHILSWLPHSEDKNVLFMTYEDMKMNLPQAVSEIASFMGVDLSSDTISKIADLASFDKMKTDKTANKSWKGKFRDESGNPMFIRKGIVGDWKNFLSPEQAAEIDAVCAERLKGTGLKLNFE